MRMQLFRRCVACNLTLIALRGDITYKAKCLQPGMEGHDLQQLYSTYTTVALKGLFLSGFGHLSRCDRDVKCYLCNTRL